MDRKLASKYLRQLLDQHCASGNWKIRLISDLSKPFLGMTDYGTKTVFLNSFHIDTHGDAEVLDTIRHEVAHCIAGSGAGHGEEWKKVAIQLGASPLPCVHYGFDESAIDAIRSGASQELEITYEEHVIRTPKYKITKLEERCPVCNKIAKEIDKFEIKNLLMRKLECGHFITVKLQEVKDYESFVFDLNDSSCAPGKHTWAKNECVTCSAHRLMPFQVLGAKEIERHNGRFGLFDEQGLGKTIQAIAYIAMNLAEVSPFLWVTKSGIKYQHLHELNRLLPKTCVIQAINRGHEKPIKGFSGYIMGYDLFRRMELKSFTDVGIKLAVLDECQMIKNPDSSRTQAIRSVLREVPRIIPLSGTPWKNNGSEFFVVLNLLDPVLFNSYKSFVNIDCDTYWEGNRRKIGGIADPEKFKKKIEHLAIRRERKFVLPELPQTNRVRTYCELDKAGGTLYSEEETKVARILQDAILEGTEDTFGVKSLIQQSIMVMRQIIGLAKVDTIVEVADEFLQNSDRKLCIFLHHIKVADLVEAKLKSLGHNPLRLAGGTSAEEKYQIQEKFRGPNHRLLIASTLSAGEGLNLQECSDFIIGERQWNAANEEQAEDRFNRIGQKADQVNGIYILARDTVDEDLDGIIERKRKQYETVMNKEGYQVKWSEDSVTKEVMNQLLSRYNKRKGA